MAANEGAGANKRNHEYPVVPTNQQICCTRCRSIGNEQYS
jgi:hypothetical protein